MRSLMFRLVSVLFAVGILFTTVPAAHAQGGGRWIDVNLTNQTTTAYEGNTPIYTALATTGNASFPTPTGTFSILRRVANETMDSSTIGIPRDGPGGYYVTDVYYTQYFTGYGNALHANWWSPASAFGNYGTSHGCVGLTTADAGWFWNFATIGTPVVVHY